LVKDRTAAKNRGKILTVPLLKQQNTQRLQYIERQIEAVEAQIMAHIEADPNCGQALRDPDQHPWHLQADRLHASHQNAAPWLC
jgi:hypothetical protein